MRSTEPATLWEVLAEFPLFILRLFTFPRQLVRRLDWDDPHALRRLALYTVLWLLVLLFAFSDNRHLADEARPGLATFKGIVMRAHDRSWDLLEPLYTPFNLSAGEAKRLWDTLLTRGFVAYTLFASLLGIALVVRLRMALKGLSWHHALGTGLLGYLALVSCTALSLVPLAEELICRSCVVRIVLFVLLNVAAWVYLGYYTLGDLGERPRNWLLTLAKSLGWGLAQYVVAFLAFLVLIACIIPL